MQKRYSSQWEVSNECNRGKHIDETKRDPFQHHVCWGRAGHGEE